MRLRVHKRNTDFYEILADKNGRYEFAFAEDFVRKKGIELNGDEYAFYGKYIKLTKEDVEWLLNEILTAYKEEKDDDFLFSVESDYGKASILKFLYLRNLYDEWGYDLEIECDW